MTVELFLAYIATVLIFMSTPGPSHLLMLSNSLGNGFNKALSTAAGDLSANVLQMTIAALGLASLIRTSQEFFLIVKWAGVAYLIYMGVRHILRKSQPNVTGQVQTRTQSSLYWQGFITSAANPKAVIFFAALFPQFVNPTQPTGQQFLLLGITYVFIDGCFLAAYGGFASWIADKFSDHVGKYMNQVSGSLLIVAALLLGLKAVRQNH